MAYVYLINDKCQKPNDKPVPQKKFNNNFYK